MSIRKKKKLRTFKNLILFADNCRKKDQALLIEFKITSSKKLVEKYEEKIQELIVTTKELTNKDNPIVIEDNDEDKTMHDKIKNPSSKVFDLNYFKNKLFVYNNYDDDTDIRNTQWKPLHNEKKVFARNCIDEKGMAYVRFRKPQNKQQKFYDAIFENIYQKVLRTRRSNKLLEYCKYNEDNFIEWKNDLYIFKSEKDRVEEPCVMPHSSEKKSIFIPLSIVARRGLQKFIYIKKKIKQNSTRKGILDPKITIKIQNKSIAFV